MNDTLRLCEHSVEAHVSAAFAWSFWTDIRNWDDPPARFMLDGPFADGSRGTTRIAGPGAIALVGAERSSRPVGHH